MALAICIAVSTIDPMLLTRNARIAFEAVLVFIAMLEASSRGSGGGWRGNRSDEALECVFVSLKGGKR